MNAELWRQRLDGANAIHVRRVEALLRREFQRLLESIDRKRPHISDQIAALRGHERRLAVIFAIQLRAVAIRFGFIALDMANATPVDAKAEPATPPTRAERVAAVLRELARAVAFGVTITPLLEAMAGDRALIAAIEIAIITDPEAKPALIAARLLESPRIAARIAQAQTQIVAADAAALADAARAPPPPAPPPPGSSGGAKPPPRRVFSQVVERIVTEHAPMRARRIAATSSDVIARVLGEGARNGWSEEKLARALEAALGGDISRRRARVIARTEIGAAQNGATLAIARDREAALGQPLEKVWISIDDVRRRPSHGDAEGQARALDQPFAVGLASLQYPGDPNGPLKEIVNCRCALVIRPSLAGDRRAVRE